MHFSVLFNVISNTNRPTAEEDGQVGRITEEDYGSKKKERTVVTHTSQEKTLGQMSQTQDLESANNFKVV